MTTSLSELNVLIVDDDAFMINLMKNVLQKIGIDAALEANDGASALDRLNGANVDVIICDLNMPGMDGIEFLRHLAGRESHPAVIMLSSVDESVLKTAEQLGRGHGLRILGTLPKPVKRELLEALLAQVGSGAHPPRRALLHNHIKRLAAPEWYARDQHLTPTGLCLLMARSRH